MQLTGVPPIVPADAGDSLRTFPIGTGPYRFVRYEADDKLVLSAFEGYWDGPPNNAGIVMKVVPDDTMRGLELRKGTTDLVVNDLPPDIVHQLEKSEPVLDRALAGTRLLLPGLQHAGPGPGRCARPACDRLRDQSRRHHQVPASRPGPSGRRPGAGSRRGRSSRTSFASRTIPIAPRHCWTKPAIGIRTATVRCRGSRSR